MTRQLSSLRTGRDPRPTERIAEFFKLLGDPTRLRIVYALAGGELSVTEVSDAIELSPSAVSHQLSLLRRARLVAARREGKQIFYRLDDDHVSTIIAMAREHLEE
jgi:ArsR family transcriptional regulator, lead/cadmium/zinc/bismuth-responsive transcriptional repressor